MLVIPECPGNQIAVEHANEQADQGALRGWRGCSGKVECAPGIGSKDNDNKDDAIDGAEKQLIAFCVAIAT